ncbi:MAG: hypothetical protein KDD62_15910, partial [Bdellovibrionales bacterium]|nr:hypothetical protein [Bdellovibrionales bacterium]
FQNLLRCKSAIDFAQTIFNQWDKSPLQLVTQNAVLPTSMSNSQEFNRLFSHRTSIAEIMSLFDTEFYIPDDLNVKVDRASMAHSLECREPLLDHRLFELAFSFPESYRGQSNNSKRILKSVLEKYVPKSLFERPKRGFSIPLERWLNGALRGWCQDLLMPSHIQKSGLLIESTVQKLTEEHFSLGINRAPQIWQILAFQSWYDSITASWRRPVADKLLGNDLYNALQH